LFETKRFERATQLLQDLPGAALDGAPRFGPGSGAGDVEPTFVIAPKGKPWGLDANVDNNGLATTGRTRFTVSGRANNLIGIGDDYAASVTVTTKEMWTGSLSASVPILSDGLRLAAGFTRQQYSVNAAGTTFAGVSNTGSLGLTYPFARGLDFNMWGGVSYLHSETSVDYKDFDFATHGKIDALKLSLSANNGDRAQQLRTDLWSASAALTLGRQRNDDPLDAGPRRAGTYAKLTTSAFGRLTLAKDGDLFATASLSGQLASRNLDSSEQLTLGGPYAVRAYRADEGLADTGAILSLGLYKRFSVAKGHQLQLGPIADIAVAKVNAKLWDGWEQSYVGIPGIGNSRTLAGYGAEAAWLTPWGFTLSASVSKPFGFSDGSWVRPGKRPVQTWLSLSWSR
jgi:hemolysin activation/secretion protein